MLDRHRPFPRRAARSARICAALTLTLALAAGLSACGSSGGSSTATITKPGEGSTSATESGSNDGSEMPSGPRGSGGASAMMVKVCDLLPVADVAKLSGLPLTKAEEVALPTRGTPPIAKCSYTSDDRLEQIGVTTHNGGNADVVKKVMSDQAGIFGSKKVSGVGDLAYFSPTPGRGGLTVLYGTTQVDVSATQDIQQDVAIKIADALHVKL